MTPELAEAHMELISGAYWAVSKSLTMFYKLEQTTTEM